MPSNHSRSENNTTSSSPNKGSALYSNKDGSQFISVPKSPSRSLSAGSHYQISTQVAEDRMANSTRIRGGENDPGLAAPINPSGTSTAAAVNRKKQKRRQKQAAARQAAEQAALQSPEQYSNGRYMPAATNGRSALRDPRAGLMSPPPSMPARDLGYVDAGLDEHDQYDGMEGDGLYYSDDEDGQLYEAAPYDPGNAPPNGHLHSSFDPSSRSSKKSKKKKKGKVADPMPPNGRMAYPGDISTSLSPPPTSFAPPPPPPPPLAVAQKKQSISRDRIWNTSTQEERERIKEFWLSLGEDDRRSLVKVEKEAVLRKMKEQQKHSCSCTVCGRKRTAIEEELEVLYDAYYEELEHYANHQQVRPELPPSALPSSGRFSSFVRSHPGSGIPPLLHDRPPHGRVEEIPEDDEDEDDEEEDGYSEDEDEEDLSDMEPEEPPQGPAADFFNFGNSLTVQGGILTVADDLLKNDGKKFIEMMEQLAERRMQREEEAHYAAAGLGHPAMNMPGQHMHPDHGHPPHPDDDEYDDEDEDDYESQEEDDYDDDEMESMTEEQRMEEGRRMFQIFAARMFEQRVLTAYREKVAQERQQKLLEELEEESRLDTQREQKKAKDAQKKKDKKRLQKQAKDEEKARKDAEKAAEEAAAKAAEEKKAEEQKQRKEEQRKKREAEKKAQEELRQKKELEKQKRLQEERDKQAELERKQREQKEREKKKREEAKKKERDERDAKEKSARDKKEAEQRDRKPREAQARPAPQEAKGLSQKDAGGVEKPAPQATHSSAATSRRSSQLASAPASAILNSPHTSTGVQSPHLPVATPAIPKAPTPAIKQRQTSQQGSVASSPKTPGIGVAQGQATSPGNATQRKQSPGAIGPPGRQGQPLQQQSQPQQLSHHGLPPVSLPPTAPSQAAPSSMPGMPRMPPGPPSYGQQPKSARGSLSHEGPVMPPYGQPISAPQRQVVSPPGIPFQQGSSQPQPRPPHQGLPPPDTNQQFRQTGPPAPVGKGAPGMSYNTPREGIPATHSRQPSASFEGPSLDTNASAPATQPISRPAPIQRPTNAGRQAEENAHRQNVDVDDLSRHLGSSALLDDSDEPFPAKTPAERHSSFGNNAAVGAGRSRFGFGAPPVFPHGMPQTNESRAIGSPTVGTENWNVSSMPMMAHGVRGNPAWAQNQAPGPGWSSGSGNTFGVIGGPNRPAGAPRARTLRLLVCQACKQLSVMSPQGVNGSGMHDVNTVHRQIENLRPPHEAPISVRDILDICDTEGDAHNGGGFFNIKSLEGGRTLIRHEGGLVDSSQHLSGPPPPSVAGDRKASVPGDIGSSAMHHHHPPPPPGVHLHGFTQHAPGSFSVGGLPGVSAHHGGGMPGPHDRYASP